MFVFLICSSYAFIKLVQGSLNGTCFSYKTLGSGRIMSIEKSKDIIYNKRNNNKTARVDLERKITNFSFR